MSRTKSIVESGKRFDLIYFYKCKRHLIKLFSRKAHHALRNQNRSADELSFMMFKQSQMRRCYRDARYVEQKEIFGRSLGEYGDKLRRQGKGTNDSMRKRLQEQLRKMRREDGDNPQLMGMRRKSRKVSDVFIAAHKKFKRRGSLTPFQGHRERGVLYKRQLAYWL